MFNLNVNYPKKAIDFALVYDFVALGLGPASLSAGIYAVRKGLKTLVVGNELGGQLKNTSEVDNYLGFPLISAAELISNFKKHLDSLEVPLLTDVIITEITKNSDIFVVKLNNGKQIQARTLLYALGGHSRKLAIPGEDNLSSKGVSYCVTCDGAFYKDRNVVVAGGGNSALDAALELSRTARNVTLIQRSVIKGDRKTYDLLKSKTNVAIKENTGILSINGSDKVSSLTITDKTSNKVSEFETDAIFIEIGNIPNTALIKDLVKLNEFGQVVVDEQQMTTLPGLYAAGDVIANSKRQIIIAAGEGAKAAISASEYLNK